MSILPFKDKLSLHMPCLFPKLYPALTVFSANTVQIQYFDALFDLYKISAATPDKYAPDTLGWRCWIWTHDNKLISPYFNTVVWHSETMQAENWGSYDDSRNNSVGIHALLMPINWRQAGYPYFPTAQLKLLCNLDQIRGSVITGIVERFGKFVLGDLGWRSEWVIIKELQTDSPCIADLLQQRFPQVSVFLKP